MVPYHGKKNCVDVIKLRILRWEDHPGLPGWAQWNHKRPYNREASRSRAEGHGMMETKGGMMCFEDGRSGHKPQGRQPLEAGKSKEMDSFLELPEGMQPCWHLDFKTSDLQNRIKICYNSDRKWIEWVKIIYIRPNLILGMKCSKVK